MEEREMPGMQKYGESKMTRTVCHVTSSSGLRKFQAAWFLLNRGYNTDKILSATLNTELTMLGDFWPKIIFPHVVWNESERTELCKPLVMIKSTYKRDTLRRRVHCCTRVTDHISSEQTTNSILKSEAYIPIIHMSTLRVCRCVCMYAHVLPVLL
jgi:hypothetical protein